MIGQPAENAAVAIMSVKVRVDGRHLHCTFFETSPRHCRVVELDKSLDLSTVGRCTAELHIYSAFSENIMKLATAISIAFFGFTFPATAQDAHPGHGGASTAVDTGLIRHLPEICQAEIDAGATAAPLDMGHQMDEAHTDLMAGMDKNNQLMMTAGMVDDLDVAFVCAMIPHHQSAINMAKAELEHGDDAWARELAQKIIAAQEAEITEMMEWLSAGSH
jgi:hypothetical protein